MSTYQQPGNPYIKSVTKMFKMTDAGTRRGVDIIAYNIPREDIVKTFDQSFCAVAYQNEQFWGVEPELTSAGYGYEMNPYPITNRTKKQAEREFKVIPRARHPGPTEKIQGASGGAAHDDEVKIASTRIEVVEVD